jgi:hypothetical protein
MPALVAGIHVFFRSCIKDVDGRDEPGHDVERAAANTKIRMIPTATDTDLSRY